MPKKTKQQQQNKTQCEYLDALIKYCQILNLAQKVKHLYLIISLLQ